MRNLINEAKYKMQLLFCSKDIDISAIDESTMPELQELQKEIDESYPPKIPEMNTEKTALFSTTTSRSAIHFYNLPRYRSKIEKDCHWLTEHGYTTLIANYGNQYGMLALETLLELRKQGCDFRLFTGKVMGERRSLLHNGFKEICMVADSDQYFGAHNVDEFIKQVILKVSVISSETALFYSRQKIPRSLFKYYRTVATQIYF